jgi:membrane protease YdiL (CAAX protease family)
MVIIPAFTQETLFKGIILNGFSENYSQKKSIIISAVLYGIVEYAFSPFWLFVVAGFLYGIISAWIYLNTKSLVPGIFINMFIKAAYILLFKFSDMVPIAELEMAYTDHPFKLQWFDGIGLVLATAGIFLLVKSIKKHKTAIDDSI